MTSTRDALYGLFVAFAPLSLVTIGGGQATVAEIQRQVVDVHHWMTATQFLDVFALGRLAPGPGSLMVALIGWHVAGLWGALAAILSMFLPTAFLMLGVAYLWKRHRGARWQRAMEAGLRPIAAGMILAAVYVLFLSLAGGWTARIVSLASTVLMLRTKLNPLVVVIGGGVLMVSLFQLGLVF